jgi:hypothetical protein
MQEYLRQKYAYLEAFERQWPSVFHPLQLKGYLDLRNVDGYGDKSVTDEMIMEVYLEFSNTTRKPESDAYLRTRTGEHNEIMKSELYSLHVKP